MIDGIPYWCSETFEEMRALSKVVDLKEKMIDEIKANSLYTLFYELAKTNQVIRIKEGDSYFYSYVRDVCFNYRDKLIFLPYWSYKESIVEYKTEDRKHLDLINDETLIVRHSFCKLIDIIDNRHTKERKEYIEIYDTENKEFYKVKIKELPYIKEDNFLLEDLYKRYINSAYYNMDNEEYDFDNRYHRIGKEHGYNVEYKIRKKYSLPHWRKGLEDYTVVDYKDVRMYNYNELNAALKLEFQERMGYWERRFLFEAYLYCIFAEDIGPKEEDYKFDYNQLGVSKRVLKYGVKNYPLFLKYYYKDNILLKKMSYEKYLKHIS